MPGLLGKKIGMTSVYSENGNVVPVTVIEAGPCEVLAVKSEDRDGYNALQVGFGNKKEKHSGKSQKEYLKKHNLSIPSKVKEFKNFDTSEYKIGDKITVEIFKVGDIVKVSGKSKGKGFQGVMRRHGFGGVGGTTHGQSDRLRAPGSVGASSYPSRVIKGMRMAGRTGGNNTTVAKLKVVQVLPEKNLILISGAVPGAVNSVIEINK